MKKHFLNSMKWFAVFALAGSMVTACSDDDDDDFGDVDGIVESEIYKVNLPVYSRISVNDKVYEECVDSVMNLGSEKAPALFFVNQKHQVKGNEVPEGVEDLDCVFTSLNLKELNSFVELFAKGSGVIKEGQKLTKIQKFRAFRMLRRFLDANNIDGATFFYLLKERVQEFNSIKQIVASGTTRGVSDANYDINEIFRKMVLEDIAPSEFIASAHQHGMTLPDYFIALNEGGLNKDSRSSQDLDCYMLYNNEYKGTKFGVEAFDFRTVFISKNDYFSCISRKDDNLENYNVEADTEYQSPEFYYYHGVSSTPLVGVKFHYVFTPAKNVTFSDPYMKNYNYLKKVSTDVTYVRCLYGQHLKGKWTCMEGKVDGNGNAVLDSEMFIKYGDGWLNKKVARLKAKFEGNRFVYLSEDKYKE